MEWKDENELNPKVIRGRRFKIRLRASRHWVVLLIEMAVREENFVKQLKKAFYFT